MPPIRTTLPLLLAVACGGSSELIEPGPLAVVTVGPEAPCTTDPLVATLENGTAESWSWTVNGEPTDITGAEVPAEATSKSQRWRAVADLADSDRQAAGSIIVKNCGPTAPTVELSPTEPTGLDELVATMQATDPDGDVLTYHFTWSVNGEEAWSQVTGSSQTSFSLDGLGRGAVVSLQVFASDGLNDSEPAEASVEVANTPPTTPGIRLNPESPRIFDPFVCDVQTPSTDVDDDEITYEVSWTVDGSDFTAAETTTLTGDTIPAEATSDQQVWTCTIAASDGADTSEPATVSATVVAWEDVMFTTCGSEGRDGPTADACIADYAGTPLEDMVSVSEGIQVWQAPSSGRYTITAAGAEGGEQVGAASPGGLGAIVRAEVELVAGEDIYFMVGQKGGDNNDRGDFNGAAGGGGGTFVVDASGAPLVVAGAGGGGDHDCGGETTGQDGHTGTRGLDGSPRSSSSGPGGRDGDGGSYASGSGGGGGGFYTNGLSSSDQEGRAYINGGRGGVNYDSENWGGFGGGGGTSSQFAGGGGGYSGGGSTGNCYEGDAGGGGGSFLPAFATSAATSDGRFETSGTEPDAAYEGEVEDLDEYNTGHGWVEITR